MPDLSRRSWLGLPAPLPAASACVGPASTPKLSPSREAIRKRYFPDVVLTTHEGKQVRFYEDLLMGKIVTINFMYSRCPDGVCPVTTHNLVQVQKIIKARVGRNRLGH